MIRERDFQKLINRINSAKDFAKEIMERGLEFLDRYYSMYEGFVADTNDPEDRGRIKVRVPTLNLPDNEPLQNWALPKFRQPVPEDGKGSYWVPREGSLVFVEFLQGNLNCPVWSGGFYGTEEKPEEFESTEDRGFKTPGGHYFRFRDEEGRESITLQHVRDALFEMAEDDTVTIQTKEGDVVTLDPDGSLNVEHRNGAKVELDRSEVVVENNTGSSLSLNGPRGKIQASGTIEVSSPSVVVGSSNIALGGSGSSSPGVRGDVLLSYLGQLATWMQSHVHQVPPPVGAPVTPPSVPLPPIPPSILSSTVRTS